MACKDLTYSHYSKNLQLPNFPNAPTLLLGVEEPELYQHPPQARHLADVFGQMAKGNNQVLITTHSPMFVSGDGFENTQLVRAPQNNTGSKVKSPHLQEFV